MALGLIIDCITHSNHHPKPRDLGFRGVRENILGTGSLKPQNCHLQCYNQYEGHWISQISPIFYYMIC